LKSKLNLLIDLFILFKISVNDGNADDSLNNFTEDSDLFSPFSPSKLINIYLLILIDFSF
jgi:hypothetical protein